MQVIEYYNNHLCFASNAHKIIQWKINSDHAAQLPMH